MFCEELQLEMPESFPDDAFTEFLSAARRTLLGTGKDAAWQEFAGATNLIGWRFRACEEVWGDYKRSWQEYGPSITFEEMYFRQDVLFRMFSAGVSCLDSTAYALAAFCSHERVLGLPFGFKEQRACSLRKLSGWLKNYPHAAGLGVAVTDLADSDEFEIWIELRNRMAHRSNLPRIVEGAIGEAPRPVKPLHFARTSSTRKIAGDLAEFDLLQRWLASSLRRLLVEGRAVISS